MQNQNYFDVAVVCRVAFPNSPLYTDAAAGFGFGAIFGKLWCFGPWPEHWKLFNIVILEFYLIVLSVLLWGPLMRNQRILFYTDNAALVDIINKTTSRNHTIMVLVRQLVLACLKFNIFFRAHATCSWCSLHFSRCIVSLTGFKIQGTSTSGRTGFADRYSQSPYATQLVNITSTLIQSSLQPSSIPTYRRAWRLYTQFSNRVLNSSAIPVTVKFGSIYLIYV